MKRTHVRHVKYINKYECVCLRFSEIAYIFNCIPRGNGRGIKSWVGIQKIKKYNNSRKIYSNTRVL